MRHISRSAPSHRAFDLDSYPHFSLPQFDKLDDTEGGSPWLPCPKTRWCGKFGDRWATSIVNADIRKLYYTETPGFVLATTAQAFCAYGRDGNSMARLCSPLFGDGETCIPGCSPKGKQCNDPDGDWECSYPAHELQDALEYQIRRGDDTHNEVSPDAYYHSFRLRATSQVVCFLSGCGRLALDCG